MLLAALALILLPVVPTMSVGALSAAACALGLATSAPSVAQVQAPGPVGSALRPREALLVVLLLAAGAVPAGNVRRCLGGVAADIGVALAGLVDAHAPIAALAAQHAAGSLSLAHWLAGVRVAISANTLTHIGEAAMAAVAAVAGGSAFALIGQFGIARGIASAPLNQEWPAQDTRALHRPSVTPARFSGAAHRPPVVRRE
ncbi:MAG: hypothetical protein JO006_11480 [Paucibacter sp.]|nr:hypothetical protein [Roseateles sp.]